MIPLTTFLPHYFAVNIDSKAFLNQMNTIKTPKGPINKGTEKPLFQKGQ